MRLASKTVQSRKKHDPIRYHSYKMTKPNLIKATKKAIKESPREIFNWYLLACTWTWSFSGVAKGFDEGK